MATITLKGNSISTSGDLPKVGETAKDFQLVGTNLSEKNLSDYGAQRKVLNIFPSVDTGTCAASVRRFNQEAGALSNTVVLCISKDLPFALNRFCGAEGLESVEALSAFRSSFSGDYGLEITESGLKGLCSRAVIVLDENNTVIYTEQVAETVDEPNYEAVLSSLKVAA